MLRPNSKIMNAVDDNKGTSSNNAPIIIGNNKPVDSTKPITDAPVVTDISNTDVLDTFVIGDNTFKPGDEITIDNNVYKFDKQGNAIDDAGSIIMSKDDIIKQASAIDNTELFTTVKNLTGVSVYDESGNELTFENTPEGIAKYNNALIEQTRKESKVSSINDFLESNPDIRDLYNHKQLFGTIDNYKADIDYTKIDITKLDVDAKKRFFISSEITKGNSKEYAEELWNAIKANKSEDKIVKESIKFLDKVQAEDKQQRINVIKLEEQKHNDQLATKYGYTFNDKGEVVPLNIDNSYYDLIVKKGTIAGVKIPEAGVVYKNDKGESINVSRTEILDMITSVYHDGKEFDKYGRSYGEIILSEYLANPANHINMILTLLTKKGFSGLIEATAKTKNITITTNKNTPGTGNGTFKLPVSN